MTLGKDNTLDLTLKHVHLITLQQGDGGAETGRAFGHAGKFPEHLVDVGLTVVTWAGISCRVNARFTVKGINFQASVVAETVITVMLLDIACLHLGIALDVVGSLGDILMGFAVLMTGMSAMSASVSHLRDQNWFLASLTCLSHPIAGMIVGFVITAVLQSASAAVGIIQALSVTGVMTMGTALPLLMGVTVGASVPVLLSALGASVQGRRASMVYLVASGIGTGAVAAAFYIATSIWPLEALGHIMDPFSIALVNTLLRLALVLVLLPMGDVLEGLLTLMIPEREEAFKPIHLEERFLNHPSLALEQCRLTIFDMAALARQALDAAVSLLWNFSEDGYSQVLAMEEKGDRYEDQLGTYLLKLTAQTLSEQQSREVTKYLHVLSDFERITDHARNLAESAREASDKKVIFSDAALRELHTVTDAVSDVIVLAVRAFTQEDMDEAMHVEPLEEVIDRLCDEMKLHHVQRLQQGQCTILQGFIFNDLLTNLERVSDHCSNVAVAMIELSIGSFETHEYLDALKKRGTPAFQRDLETYEARYALQQALSTS